MTQDKFVQTRRKKEAYRGTSTDDNADCADLDKSDAQVINEQFLINRMSDLSKFPSALLSSIVVATATTHSSDLQTENLSFVKHIDN